MGTELDGKVALVTGGSRGIGRACAQRLAGAGALVAVHYGSNEAAAIATVQDIEDRGGQAFPLRAPLGQAGDVENIFAQFDAELQQRRGAAHLDILLNNAAVSPFAGIEEMTTALFEEVMAINLRAPLFLIQAALPRLRNGGRIINISSITSHKARPTHIVYGASKAALNGATRSLAVALAPRGITVNAVAPGAVDTEINAGYVKTDPGYAAVIAKVALGRIGQADDIAGIVAFLASDDAGWITGQTLHADGGQEL